MPNVIILAQGTQQRMGRGAPRKQLLPLPACNGVPIIARTIRQLMHRFSGGETLRIDLITWGEVAAEVERGAYFPLDGRQAGDLRYVELPNPGNSSLRGIARYLEGQPSDRGFGWTVVLLGDVVYSWACLDALVACSARHVFAGTSDLTASTGELWGVGWGSSMEDCMIADLRDAVLRHPPFEDTYQPGQLRRWITGWRRGDLRDHVRQRRGYGAYADVDDYTMDVDLPAHMSLLEAASVSALEDDAMHGLHWRDA